MCEEEKVRFVGIYDDPAHPEGIVTSRYTPNEPAEELTMFNLETQERRKIELITSQSTGGWVSVEEAEELVPEMLEEIEGDSS